MTFISKLYLTTISVIGFGLLALVLPSLTVADWARFATYLTMATVASGMKVALPGVRRGTLSVLFLFLLVGIVEFTLPETLVMAIVATVVQQFWRAKERPRVVHVTFNVATIVIATVAAGIVYAGPLMIPSTDVLPWRLAAATITFFLVNTLAIAVIIALTENKSISATWRTCYLWSFPYYMAGGCIAGLFSYLTRVLGWQISILVLPVIYLIYRSYRLYLDHMAEAERHARALEAAAQRLTSVLESTTDCVFALRSDGAITYANERARARLFAGTDPLGTVFWGAFPKLDTSSFVEGIKFVLANGRPVDREAFFSEPNAWFEVHAYPSADGVAVYLKEITEQRELREQLRHAQKLEAIGTLAGGVAHDFNNLLTIILGYGQVVADTIREDDPVRSSMDEVLRAGERAAALTQRLLAFSRKQPVQLDVLDLSAVVAGMEAMIRRLIGEDVRLSVCLDPNTGKIRGDRNQIEQVVMNLAVNARDAMPGGGELEISTQSVSAPQGVGRGLEAGKPCAALSVRDTGHGMTPETMARIFEPFFTTKDVGKGTGLGLSTVYGIVKQGGGEIAVDSAPGRGSVFTIYLPSAIEESLRPEFGPTDTSPIITGKILLVEDEPAVRELASQILARAGYDVVSKNDGQEASRATSTELQSLQLLVTDVVMPRMSGPDLFVNLRHRYPELRVLYISGYTDHPLIRAGALSEPATLLHKPFTADQLLAKVKQLLGAN